MSNYIYLPFAFEHDMGLHITVKYLAGLDIPPAQVAACLSRFTRFTPSLHEWKPEQFDNGAKVFEFTKYDSLLTAMHNAFSELRKDDYPKYRPHVTVNPDIWQWCVDHDRTINTHTIFVGVPHYMYKGTPVNLMPYILGLK